MEQLSGNRVLTPKVVNERFEPDDVGEQVLEVLKREERANPYLIREETDLGKGTVNSALTRLTSAGWVDKRTRGLYDFVDDPRPDDDTVDELTELDVRLELGQWQWDGETADQEKGPLTGTEIDALVAMWQHVHETGETSPQEFRREVHPDNTAGRISSEWWWKVLRHPLEDTPGVEKLSQRRYGPAEPES